MVDKYWQLPVRLVGYNFAEKRGISIEHPGYSTVYQTTSADNTV